jgi:hypothetical protein
MVAIAIFIAIQLLVYSRRLKGNCRESTLMARRAEGTRQSMAMELPDFRLLRLNQKDDRQDL